MKYFPLILVFNNCVTFQILCFFIILKGKNRIIIHGEVHVKRIAALYGQVLSLQASNAHNRQFRDGG